MDRDLPANVERLLQEGLDLLQAGLIDHAVAVWTEVLHIEPGEPRALEYLRQAGVGAEEPVGMADLAGTRKELEQLLAERRYEEALELLFTARRQNPRAVEISRGIQLLKQRLVRRYLHQIGNLDHVPQVAIGEVEIEARKLTEEETEVLRLVDGISSFGDIAHESRLGRFETFRTLSALVATGALTAALQEGPRLSGERLAVVPTPTPTPIEPTAAPEPATKRSRAPNSIGWVLLGVAGALALGGAVLYLTSDRAASVQGAPDGQAAAALAVAAPPVAQPEPVAVVPDAMMEAAAAALQSPPDASVAVIEVVPPPDDEKAPPPAVAERHPPPALPPRVRVVASKPAPHPAALPVTPEPVPVKVEAPPAPAPEPPKEVATAPVQQQPAPAPIPPERLDAGVQVTSSLVQGGITRSEVDRALQRVEPTFHACYVSAAKSAGKNAAAQVKLTFIIDESGIARSAEAGSAPLPGLSDCLRDAASQVRTQLRPDVGVVNVTATIAFAPLSTVRP